MTISKRAFAKINLTLDVLSRRDDGYHNIVSLMQTISLCDNITIGKAPSGISVTWDLKTPPDERNTAFLAAKFMFRKYGLCGGINIHIEKKIPVSAGLGGGSADAAAVIEGINELYELDAGVSGLIEVGTEVGADVPFCITKGAAVAEGIGEKVLRLDADMRCCVVLVKPDIRVSTREVYSKIDSLTLARRPDMGRAAAAVMAGDVKNLGLNLFNVMELVTAKEHSVIRRLKQEMAVQGARGALMSGSGPTVYGIFENGFQADNAHAFFRSKYPKFEVITCEFYYPGSQ